MCQTKVKRGNGKSGQVAMTKDTAGESNAKTMRTMSVAHRS